MAFDARYLAQVTAYKYARK